MGSSLSLWSPPPEKTELAGEQVHLWRFRLDLPSDKITELSQLLSNDEQTRAERLLDRSKAEHFVVGRARTHQILARYLGREPDGIEFTYGEHGKPSLKEPDRQNLAFNLSHAGDWGLLAITAGIDVGVDIEQIDPRLNIKQVASNFFSPGEIVQLQEYQPARRRRGFYRIWTRKEACLKMAGSGFSTPQLNIQEGQIRSFVVDRDYLGAVAVTGDLPDVWCWNFTA